MRTKPRFNVELYRPDRDGRSWTLLATYGCGSSLPMARQTAHMLVSTRGTEETMWSHRDHTWYADILQDGQRIESVEAPIRIVPSVGEIGITP